ncbi:MAG TPA: anti-sigma factor [Casimicrobiaceae bacterium]|nr:anti-sigma factor [Casimicrobiaceae bacterium]
MNCDEAMNLLPVYADGELDAVQSAEIEKHLLGCAGCAARRDELANLRSRVQAEVPYYAATPALRERVRAAIARSLDAPVPPPVKANRWRWLTSGALAGSAATVFAWFIGSAILDWQVGTDLVAEAVSNHARATLSHRLTDVESSDQHTVKPWLSARLDYSPPVRDFSADGLPLVGGRVDYLDGRPVATLVYKYREHTIDVFMRPVESGKPTARPKSAALRGFNVAHGSAGGMECWVVSDASMEVLDSLVAHLTSNAG